jgi:hypothetical protein
MNKIISISVWGDIPRYTVGLKRQYELCKEFYPDWKIKLYTDNKNRFSELEDMDIIEVTDGSYGMYWRFLSLFENKDTIVLVRDSDSRITIREKMAVEEWLSSDKKFHTFKDHEAHYEFPIIGCAFGLKGCLSEILLEKMQNYRKAYPVYLGDQYYLRDIVWPEVKHSCLTHSMREGWFGDTRIKLKNRYSFCGNGYDEFDMPLYGSTLKECENFSSKNLSEDARFDKGILI